MLNRVTKFSSRLKSFGTYLVNSWNKLEQWQKILIGGMIGVNILCEFLCLIFVLFIIGHI